MSDNIIQCDHLVKTYGKFTALSDLCVDIPQGEIFGLLGPNGAGKTTTIRIINKIIRQDSGKVYFNGNEMTEEDVRKIGYMPEERGLYRKMKVGEQCIFFARLKGMSKADAVAELHKWFRKFEIQSWWNKKVEDLSKGMAQKVQFIITVVHKPKLLILDEPFSGFDPVNTQLIRNEILALKEQGSTIMLSTHNMESVEELCDSIALINKSKLVVTGKTNDIRREYGANRVTVVYRPASAEAEALPESPLYSELKDEEYQGMRCKTLEVAKNASNRDVIAAINPLLNISAYEELIPRMNDIFIKLVS
jgi:ABC-2 type transport system ATP-binding protein